MFTEQDYAILHQLVFRPDYAGYRPNVVESPNGDGNLDSEKRYAHISLKYLDKKSNDYFTLDYYLRVAHENATRVAIALGVPPKFWPVLDYSATRVLEYPPGSLSHPHTDFDLFTLSCYRNLPYSFKAVHENRVRQNYFDSISRGLHMGELIELIMPRVYSATTHRVLPDLKWQFSIVHFAIPDHDAVLPSGQRVGQWIEERSSRSRFDTIVQKSVGTIES